MTFILAFLLMFLGCTFGLIALFCVWFLYQGGHEGVSPAMVIKIIAFTTIASGLSFKACHEIWKRADRRPPPAG